MRFVLAFCAALAILAGGASAKQDFLPADLQQALADRGFDPGPVDGRPGARTEAAIRAFQEANDLAVNGQPTLETAMALGLVEVGVFPEDIDSAMDEYFQMMSRFAIFAIKHSIGISVMTTTEYPLFVNFAPNDPMGPSVPLELDGKPVDFSSITMAARGFKARPAGLATSAMPEIAGEDACKETPNTSGVGVPADLFCVTAGAFELGAVYSSGDLEVGCPKGTLEISGNNKTYKFSDDTECFVNLHHIRRSEGGWVRVEK